VAIDSSGNVFIVAPNYNIVLRLDATSGQLTIVAGNGTAGSSGDNGPATSAELDSPQGVAVDSSGNLYIADSGNQRIRKVSVGVIATVAGNGAQGSSGDNGPATSAELYYPCGVAVDSSGNLYIADTVNNRIRMVSSGAIIKGSNGVITTVAGNGTSGYSGDNGAPTSAKLYAPEGVAVDSAGNLYIADSGNNRIRKVSGGLITTVAGNGTQGYSGDNGPATSAELNGPQSVAVDSSGNVYIADLSNNRIRKVSSGAIATIAGNGTGFGGDNGAPTSAQLDAPLAVAVDPAGDVYIADMSNNRIRKVSGGVITTVAGTGAQGYNGDNGPATNAQLHFPQGVAVDSAGNLYIADSSNHRIRMVSGGVITTVAGNGNQGYSGDNGPAATAELNNPSGVAVDSAGNLYIADSGNSLVRRVSGGVITTIAGGGTTLGDNGPATSAAVGPVGLALDTLGNIYVADSENNRVRVLAPSGAPCTYTVSPLSYSAAASAANLTVSVQTASGCAWAVQSLPAWITLSGNPVSSGPGSVTLVTAANTATAARSATVTIAGLSVVVSQPGAPALTSGTVANGATYIAGGLVPGSWAQVKGANLSNVTRIWAASDFTGLGSNLPTNLSGVQVNVNNLPAAVYYISPTQVDFQVPTGISGTASVQVVNNGAASNSVTAAAVSSSPGIFPVILSGTNYAACVFWSDGLIAGNPSSGPAFRNAKPGEIVQLYATGLVSTPAGVPISPQTVSGVTVTIGSIKVTADYAGLVAVGEFQINFTVPTLAAGNYPITIQVNGVSSPATINSSPAAQIVLPIQP
jgi:uncharacterized protein (TIGR03437 family)